MRKTYIDNIRIICILLLFPFHSAYIFNNLNETFYVNGTPNELLTAWDLCVYPWWMTVLFMMAGMSVMYSLQKRTIKKFAIERVLRLFVPLVFALIFIIPPQAFIANIFHNKFTGSFLEFYSGYFKITDLSGYDGCFTPGNAWFVLYLFIYSILFIPVFLFYSKKEKKLNCKKIPFFVLILILLFISMTVGVFAPGGKSLLQFALCFLFGYFIFSDEDVQNKIEKNSIWTGVLWFVFMILREVSHIFENLWNSPFSYFCLHGITVFGILSILGLGKKFLNKEFFFTKYLAKAEFALFLLHQTIVVIVGFFIVQKIQSPHLSWALITILSFVITLGLYEILRRIKLMRFLLSIKQ